ncbi:MAG: hypothetical protein COT74_13510 [Bdellovibrionales bacterium CG10_big_fil_rev_8_21_14_0_10_45_34]|nr:MAG: hypothetical protein COT74_13510 [Bdellovibrionales bacterium CG10_big_fil_rev_8_21_14_0_10_45_34]
MRKFKQQYQHLSTKLPASLAGSESISSRISAAVARTEITRIVISSGSKFQFIGFLSIAAFAIVLAVSSIVAAATDAMIITDGAMVYRRANFDSEVIGYLPAGKKAKISSKKFGVAFYRIRFQQGVLGYISDVDVKPLGLQGASENKQEDSAQKTSKRTRKGDFFGTFLGLGVLYQSYAEIISQQRYQSTIYPLALRGTFSPGFLGGPFWLDTQLSYYWSPPDYYKALSSRPPTGYIIQFEAAMTYHAGHFWGREGMWYFGAGPVVSYSRFMVEIVQSALDLEESRLGGVGYLGLAAVYGSFLIRLEPRYYVDRANYFAVELSAQYSF